VREFGGSWRRSGGGHQAQTRREVLAAAEDAAAACREQLGNRPRGVAPCARRRIDGQLKEMRTKKERFDASQSWPSRITEVETKLTFILRKGDLENPSPPRRRPLKELENTPSGAFTDTFVKVTPEFSRSFPVISSAADPVVC